MPVQVPGGGFWGGGVVLAFNEFLVNEESNQFFCFFVFFSFADFLKADIG